MSTEDTAARNRRVGATIRRRRQTLGWEQQELAERVGVHVNSVQKWEAGTHYPQRKLGKLEEVLGVRLDEDAADPGLPTPDELDELQEHIREVLGVKAGPVQSALDEVMSGRASGRDRGPAAGRSSGRRPRRRPS
jgi:ribosome-binding protein aMBF1 (putative translation factor)